jgi:hypothetical protein
MTLTEAREAIRYCNSYSRLPTILELHFVDALSLVDTRTLLGEEWSCCDNIAAHLCELGEILFPPAAPEMMNPAEQSAFALLPTRVRIYRGADCGVNEDGLCWSLDRTVAERFPFYLRYRAVQPVLVTATVRKTHIIAVKLDPEETEVITWGARVQRVESLQPAPEALAWMESMK